VQLLGDRDEVGQLTELHLSTVSILASEPKCWTDAQISVTLNEYHPPCARENLNHVLDTR
jgi:hypothetical protein